MALLKMNKYKGDVIRVIDIDDLEDYNKFISMFEKKNYQKYFLLEFVKENRV